jgi:hypothetical protein
MDPTLVKGKKAGSGGGGEDLLPCEPLVLRASAHQKHSATSAYLEPTTRTPPPIPPLAPLGAADSATWLRFKADLLKYQGLQMQYQADLLEKQARLLQVEGQAESSFPHAQDKSFAHVRENSFAHAQEEEEKDAKTTVGGRRSSGELGYYYGSSHHHAENRLRFVRRHQAGNNMAAVQDFSRGAARYLPPYSAEDDRERYTATTRLVQTSSDGEDSSAAAGWRAQFVGLDCGRRSLGSASPHEAASSSVTPSTSGGDEEDDMDEDEEEEADGPMDLSSSRGDGGSCHLLSSSASYEEEQQLPEQQGSHMRYSTMPRIFFRQQEVGGAYCS